MAKTKTPAQTLFKGTDANVSAVRNNLIRKAPANIAAVEKLTDAEVTALNEYIDIDLLVRSANDFRAAVKTRLAKVKTPATT